MLGHVRDAPLKRHFSTTRILGNDIALGAHYMHNDVVGNVLFDLVHPSSHLIEAVFIDDAVDEYNSGCAAVVELGDAAESLLTCSVP